MLGWGCYLNLLFYWVYYSRYKPPLEREEPPLVITQIDWNKTTSTSSGATHSWTSGKHWQPILGQSESYCVMDHLCQPQATPLRYRPVVGEKLSCQTCRMIVRREECSVRDLRIQTGYSLDHLYWYAGRHQP